MVNEELPPPLTDPLEHGRCLYHLERLVELWVEPATRPLAERLVVVQATVTNGSEPIEHCWLELDDEVIDLTPSIGGIVNGEIENTYRHPKDWYYKFMGVRDATAYSAMEALTLVRAAEGQFQFWRPVYPSLAISTNRKPDGSQRQSSYSGEVGERHWDTAVPRSA